MKVKLSAYEHALNVLVDAPRNVDRLVCLAFAELRGQRDEAQERCRVAAQTLIAEIGANGPESVEETALRAASELQECRRDLEHCEAFRDLARGEAARLRGALESITVEFEHAVAVADAPRGGQSCSPTGDFVAALRLPSFVSRARWWARELRAALDGTST